jgi:hypothetical protein
VVTKPHLWRWSYRKWSRAHAQPKVTSPEAVTTGTGSHEICYAHAQPVPKVNRIFHPPRGNHVAKFGKDPI